MTLKNDRFLRALLRQKVDKTPIWIMRQAGRYLPEYRKLRAEAGSFMNLCTNPELACEVTLQPLRRFDLDAAILFSDILTIPDAMGLGLYFVEGEGPKFKNPLRSASDIKGLADTNLCSKLSYVTDAVSKVRKALDNRVPLIGFSGSPWTLATYMIEGGSSKSFSQAKSMLYDASHSAHLLLDKLAKAVTDYLNAQIESGAQAVMIFDTWGGVLTPQHYEEFSLNYMHKIIDGLKRDYQGTRIPVIIFSKGCGQQAAAMVNTGTDAIGIDWTSNLGEVRSITQSQVALQGNLDPCSLYAKPEVIEQEVEKTLKQYGSGSGHVFNLGHGINPDVNPEHVKALVDAVHRLSEPYHR